MKTLTGTTLVVVALLLFSCSKKDESQVTTSKNQTLSFNLSAPAVELYTTQIPGGKGCLPEPGCCDSDNPGPDCPPASWENLEDALENGAQGVRDYFTGNYWECPFPDLAAQDHQEVLELLQSGTVRMIRLTAFDDRILYLIGPSDDTDGEIEENPVWVLQSPAP